MASSSSLSTAPMPVNTIDVSRVVVQPPTANKGSHGLSSALRYRGDDGRLRGLDVLFEEASIPWALQLPYKVKAEDAKHLELNMDMPHESANLAFVLRLTDHVVKEVVAHSKEFLGSVKSAEIVNELMNRIVKVHPEDSPKAAYPPRLKLKFKKDTRGQLSRVRVFDAECRRIPVAKVSDAFQARSMVRVFVSFEELYFGSRGWGVSTEVRQVAVRTNREDECAFGVEQPFAEEAESGAWGGAAAGAGAGAGAPPSAEADSGSGFSSSSRPSAS